MRLHPDGRQGRGEGFPANGVQAANLPEFRPMPGQRGSHGVCHAVQPPGQQPFPQPFHRRRMGGQVAQPYAGNRQHLGQRAQHDQRRMVANRITHAVFGAVVDERLVHHQPPPDGLQLLQQRQHVPTGQRFAGGVVGVAEPKRLPRLRAVIGQLRPLHIPVRPAQCPILLKGGLGNGMALRQAGSAGDGFDAPGRGQDASLRQAQVGAQSRHSRSLAQIGIEAGVFKPPEHRGANPLGRSLRVQVGREIQVFARGAPLPDISAVINAHRNSLSASPGRS